MMLEATSEVFRETELGIFPLSWSIVSIDGIGKVVTGTTPSTKHPEYYGDEYMFVSPGDLDIELFINRTEKNLSQEGLSKTRQLPSGTVLVSCIGNIGKTGITKVDKCATNQQINAIICNEKADSVYITLAILNSKRRLQDISVKTTLPIINKSNFEKFKIPLPPLAEQRSVAYVLAKLQEAIIAQQEITDRARELKKALMPKLFTEGLRGEPTKDTEIGPMPESWDVLPFGEMVDIASGQVDPKILPYSEMIHIGPENIEEGTGKILKKRTAAELGLISGKYEFTSNDIIYSKIRPYLMKVALPDFPGICSADMYPLRPKQQSLHRSYLFQYLLSEAFTRQATSNQQRTGIPKINRNQLNSILVPRPGIEEQEEIGRCLCSLDGKIEVTRQKLELLTDLFKTMLHELMTGNIRSTPLMEA